MKTPSVKKSVKLCMLLESLRKIIDGRMTVFDQFMANVQFAVNRSVAWWVFDQVQNHDECYKGGCFSEVRDITGLGQWLHSS